jgi:multidrug efflux pump
LRRPMRNMYGGKWISFVGIPPSTLLFIPLMLVTMVRHNYKVKRRRRKLAGKKEKVNEAFIGSWI